MLRNFFDGSEQILTSNDKNERRNAILTTLYHYGTFTDKSGRLWTRSTNGTIQVTDQYGQTQTFKDGSIKKETEPSSPVFTAENPIPFEQVQTITKTQPVKYDDGIPSEYVWIGSEESDPIAKIGIESPTYCELTTNPDDFSLENVDSEQSELIQKILDYCEHYSQWLIDRIGDSPKIEHTLTSLDGDGNEQTRTVEFDPFYSSFRRHQPRDHAVRDKGVFDDCVASSIQAFVENVEHGCNDSGEFEYRRTMYSRAKAVKNVKRLRRSGGFISVHIPRQLSDYIHTCEDVFHLFRCCINSATFNTLKLVRANTDKKTTAKGIREHNASSEELSLIASERRSAGVKLQTLVAELLPQFTSQQREVFALVKSGHTRAQVAQTLGISTKTVCGAIESGLTLYETLADTRVKR